MNGNIVEESSRPRPQSAGIWTLFSWLRRSDRSSSESISSVGSDRTALSFDFLAPVQYKINSSPRVLASSPPTDTYKKRLHERNISRLRDRDISIHRKYGLLSVEDLGYDTLDSNSVVTNKHQERLRDRRAASESIHRRAAYVPGKRRAPQPPFPIVAATLPRSHKRKRPAPKPPTLTFGNKENLERTQTFLMNNHSTTVSQDKQSNVKLRVQKSHVDNEQTHSKDKSFLKQIFVNRKRNSAIDTSHIKLLPISELDKQAHEIIERNKDSKANNPQNIETDVWICTKCLRRYNTTIVSCVYCLPDRGYQTKYSKRVTIDGSNMYTQTETKDLVKRDKGQDDKEKLKEMLKEMKDSLPKRTKYQKKHEENVAEETPVTETSTLRIGSDDLKSNKISNKQPRSSKIASENLQRSNLMNSQKIKYFNPDSSTQPSHVKQSLPQNGTSIITNMNFKQNENTPTNINNKHSFTNNVHVDKDSTSKLLLNENDKDVNKHSFNVPTHLPKPTTQEIPVPSTSDNIKNLKSTQQAVKLNYLGDSNSRKIAQTRDINNEESANATERNIKTQLKVSSLLNPLYNSKNNTSTECTNELHKDNKKLVPLSVNPDIVLSSSVAMRKGKQDINSSPSTSSNNIMPVNNNLELLNPYAKRRTLINQLEQSIFNGDEKTAADVAAKLAKLRLSCSVLSFSSQIVTDNLGIIAQNENISNSKSGKLPVIENENKTKIILENNPDVLCVDTVQSNKDIPNTTKTESKGNILTPDVISNINDSKNIVQPEEPSTSKLANSGSAVPIEVWVEDKEAARGPIQLRIRRNAIMRELKIEANTSLGIAVHLQRWIIGNTLCVNEETPVVALAGADFVAPFYLCLVESDTKKTETGDERNVQPAKNSEVYAELINLEKEALVPYSESFECEVCMEQRAAGEGVVLRECLHIFCKECLADAVRHCEEPTASCLAVGCSGTLQEREIRAILSVEEYEKWLAQSLTAAESGTRNTFHCRTTDCNGWAFCEPGVRKFPCPVCKKNNCLPCQVVHDGESCEEYQEKLTKATSAKTKSDDGTQTLINQLITRGEALECPECATVITKKWGCDWVKCVACKTEICWATRGRRWGPRGRGDTSAGCRCGVAGVRCHPSCVYCH